MMTIIITIIVSMLTGFIPVNYLGVNFLTAPENLIFWRLDSAQQESSFTSQISSKVSKNLSEVDPLGSLGKATAPLDNIWKALGPYIKGLIGPDEGPMDSIYSPQAKSALEGRLGFLGNLDTTSIFGVAKSAFILIANILVTVLEIALWLLKAVLGLVN